jgi:SM-20-related protein
MFLDLYSGKTPDTRDDGVLAEKPLKDVWEALKTDMCYGQTLQRCYANGMVTGQDGQVHTDDPLRTAVTTMIYCNTEWSQDWGGETLFFDRETFKPVKAVTPTPFSIVQFSSNIPHAARMVSSLCKSMRTTLMFKGHKIYELHPDNRPGNAAF